MIHLLFAPWLALAEPRPSDFLPATQLTKDFRAYCLKKAVKNVSPEMRVFEVTDRYAYGMRFQSIRFAQSLPSISGPPDCKGEREITQIVDGGSKRVVFDSGLHDQPYCESPVQFTQPARVYEFAQLSADPEITKKRRKLAVLETFSSTLPCPDVDEVRARRFRIYDLGNENALMLDVEAEAVLPEVGDDTYRLHVVDARRVLKSMTKMEAGLKPVSIELEDGKFALHLQPTATPKPPVAPAASPTTALNSVYRKDASSVYYQLVDEGGRIEGADPRTFQLLSDDGESAYAKDAKFVYYFGKRLAKADPKTFVQLNSRYGKDIARVYHQEQEFAGVDLASFTAPFAGSAWHARDKDHVYDGTKIIPLADPQTFTIGDDRSCGPDCVYRGEDKNYRFDYKGNVVQKLAAP